MREGERINMVMVKSKCDGKGTTEGGGGGGEVGVKAAAVTVVARVGVKAAEVMGGEGGGEGDG